jgi:hypothetical protein
MNHLPPSENSRRYSQVQVRHWYHRRDTAAVNYPTGTHGVVDTGGKFATGVNETGGKFAASVNDTGCKFTKLSSVANCHRYQ